MRDVAREAGVSVAAVSYHLNGTARLSPATGARIARAVKALGYRPDPLARSLSRGRREAVGLAALVGSRPYADLFLAEILAGAAEVAAGLGWPIHYLPIRQTAEQFTWPARVLDAVAGTLMLDWAADHAPWADIRASGHAVVLLNARRRGVVSVEVDNESGGGLAAEHLLSLGHRRVALISASGPLEQQREAGARRSFRAGGVAAESFKAESSADQAREIVTRLLARPAARRPTALFATSDWMALAVLDQARRCGVRVPEDLSVVGYDDSLLAEAAGPALTTIQQPLRDMGRIGLQRLLGLVNGEHPGPALLPVRLIIRSSTGRPPPAARRTR